MIVGESFIPLLFRGGAARLRFAQQALVAAGWCSAPFVSFAGPPPPTPSSEEEGA